MLNTAANPCNPQSDAMEGDVGNCGVDRSTVVSVGAQYLNARNAHRNARIVTAYRQLQVEIDRLFNDLVCVDQPRAVRVAFTRCHLPYASDKELIAAVGAHETLEITSAAAFSGRLHPLLSCEIGGEFDRISRHPRPHWPCVAGEGFRHRWRRCRVARPRPVA